MLMWIIQVMAYIVALIVVYRMGYKNGFNEGANFIILKNQPTRKSFRD